RAAGLIVAEIHGSDATRPADARGPAIARLAATAGGLAHGCFLCPCALPLLVGSTMGEGVSRTGSVAGLVGAAGAVGPDRAPLLAAPGPDFAAAFEPAPGVAFEPPPGIRSE